MPADLLVLRKVVLDWGVGTFGNFRGDSAYDAVFAAVVVLLARLAHRSETLWTPVSADARQFSSIAPDAVEAYVSY